MTFSEISEVDSEQFDKISEFESEWRTLITDFFVQIDLARSESFMVRLKLSI